jgi:hypothetical protein
VTDVHAQVTFPTPWEDVPPGVDRDEPWLALTDEAIETRLWLRAFSESLYHVALTAARPTAAPAVNTFWGRMSDPHPGDLVLEVSTPGIVPERLDGLTKGLGFLVDVREEYVHTHDEWAECADQYRGQERPTERIWYVQYGPSADDVCRWENCRFVALPTVADEFRVNGVIPQRRANGWSTL